MTPLVKSSSRNKWQRIPKEHVFYHSSPQHRGIYVLSFTFAFDKEDDVFQFALAPPYSYSRCQTFLKNLQAKAKNLKNFKREYIGNSVQNRSLDLITIGSMEMNENLKVKKRTVVIMARVHPGETPSSFVCQGLLELLISSNAVAAMLRDHIVFKVIPMMNPDGVFLGNHRSTAMGLDLNRSWNVCSSFSHPTLFAALNVIKELDESNEVDLDFVIDIHAHSSLHGCFVYGNTYEDVYRYERHILFPKILSSVASDYKAEHTMFNADVNKQGTARRFLCSTLSNRVNCYTFEVSIFGYKLKGSDNTVAYTEESYMATGRNLIRAFLEYYKSIGVIPVEPMEEVGNKKKKRKKKIFYSYRNRRNYERKEAPLHYKDININYETESGEESSRYVRSPIRIPRSKTSDFFIRSEKDTPTIVFYSQPTLTIIDFNSISRQSLDKAIKLRAKIF